MNYFSVVDENNEVVAIFEDRPDKNRKPKDFKVIKIAPWQFSTLASELSERGPEYVYE